MILRLLLAVCCLAWATPSKAAALTAEQIVWLKQNGVSEATIQGMCQNWVPGSFADADRFGVDTIVGPDGRKAIVYSTGGAGRSGGEADAEARLKEERAWEMLRHMIVDTRGRDDGRPTPRD